MQPHSMCGVALSAIIWNPYENRRLQSGEIVIQYTRRGRSERKYYQLDITNIDPDGYAFACRTMHTNGSLSCEITLRRSSTSFGSRVEIAEHSIQHKTGLREYFNLERGPTSARIVDGNHDNSALYGRFEGGYDHGSMQLNCQVRRNVAQKSAEKDADFIWMPYTLELERADWQS